MNTSAMGLKNMFVYFVFVFIVLSSILISVLTLTEEEITNLAKACNGTNADIEVLKKYKVPDTETGKCLMLCLLDRFEMLNPDGSYDKPKTLNALKAAWKSKPAEQILAIAEHCETQMSKQLASSRTKCDKAYKIIKCINDEAWKLGWFGEKINTV